jgi:hypothetical protein
MTHLNNKLADALREIQVVAVDADLRATYHRTALETISRMAREALAEHDAQPPPVAYHANYVLVPRVPTPEMDAAGKGALSDNGVEDVDTCDALVCYAAMIAAAPQPAPAPVQVDELSEVARVIDEGGGFWRPCSGCYETSDGCNVNGFSFSEAFRCDQGGGCDECGGIGVVWDNLDYAAADDNAHPPAPAADGAGELPPLPNPWQCETRICPALFTGEQMRNYVIAALAALRQPVPDAVRELPEKWRRDSDGWYADDFNRGRQAAAMKCADELESALASQQESRK